MPTLAFINALNYLKDFVSGQDSQTKYRKLGIFKCTNFPTMFVLTKNMFQKKKTFSGVVE